MQGPLEDVSEWAAENISEDEEWNAISPDIPADAQSTSIPVMTPDEAFVVARWTNRHYNEKRLYILRREPYGGVWLVGPLPMTRH